MKTYRTRVLLITEVAAANERQAYEKSSSVMERLREHLQLALDETRVVLVSQQLGAGTPAAGDQRQYGITLELHLEVNSAQRAGEELKKALPLLTTYARLALEGSWLHFRELQASEIFLKRY
jgi:hypothetical protein